MTSSISEKKYRKDYKSPSFGCSKAFLDFNLDFDVTTVSGRYECYRTEYGKEQKDTSLVLNSSFCKLVELKLHGKELKKDDGYTVGWRNEPESIVIPNVTSDKFEIEIKCENYPSKNTELAGMYKTRECIITHNEPEGFRRIVPFLDQPDVLVSFQVRIEGDKAKFPVLISNGNEIKREELANNRHAITFQDPWPKAPYLFAVVAGKLEGPETTITTGEGRKVKVRVLAEPEYAHQLEWALECLRRAMKWDEKMYGRYYDLDVFTAVAVSDFNMGAMENKSLNIFNVATLACREDVSDDTRYQRVLSVIGHEYFHNWSGNRVTVRDWFQITLKEGFTAFREASFEGDSFDPAVKRIREVQFLKSVQFPEDASTISHPIRPESYVEVDNFYTMTIYKKGAQVIRMYRELLGAEGFRKGTDYYFSTYDGKAISCDEFRESMARANGRDLRQFERWYFERRTPVLEVTRRAYDDAAKKYFIKIKQTLPKDANPNGEPLPLHIPIRTGLIGRGLKKDAVPEKVLELTDWEQEFVFDGVNEDVVPSVLRGFSAPVILRDFLSDEDTAFLFAHDSDGFNQWDSAQRIYSKEIAAQTQALAKGGAALGIAVSPLVIDCFGAILRNEAKMSRGLQSEMLHLPPVDAVCSVAPGLDPYVVVQAKEAILRQLVTTFRSEIESLRASLPDEPAGALQVDAEAVARRSLKVHLQAILTRVADAEQEKVAAKVYDEYKSTSNYTLKRGALCSLGILKASQIFEKGLEEFYQYAKGKDDNTLDCYFIHVATAMDEKAFARITEVAARHPDFINSTTPNRIRALLSAMAGNPHVFHHPSGRGYDFLVDGVIRVDKFNSALASRLVRPLNTYGNYCQEVQDRMRAACKRVIETPGISVRTKEVAKGA